MPTAQSIVVTAHSAAPPRALYPLLVDASTWPSWSPIDRATVDRPGARGPVGEIRRFQTGRTTSVEEVVEVDPDRRLSYILLSGLPLRDYRADIELEPEADGTTIRWQSRFHPARPGTGWLYRLILRRFLQRMANGLAEAARDRS